ncbi:MAG: N-acetyltransferase family protein, partial [Bacteroidales bacterium]
MKAIEIKKVILNDIDQLQQLARQTFSETFAAVNTEENMRKYLDERFSTQKLSAEINDTNSEFYFATIDHRVIGYLKLNFGAAQTEPQDERAMEIERIYVIREFHGQKVGQLLYEKAIQISEEKG